MGLKLGKSSLSSEGFFSFGVRTPCLNFAGTTASSKDRFTVRTITGSRVSEQSFMSLPGRGSSIQDFPHAFASNIVNSSALVGVEECTLQSGSIRAVDSWWSVVFTDVTKPFLIACTFSVKKSAKRFAGNVTEHSQRQHRGKSNYYRLAYQTARSNIDVPRLQFHSLVARLIGDKDHEKVLDIKLKVAKSYVPPTTHTTAW